MERCAIDYIDKEAEAGLCLTYGVTKVPFRQWPPSNWPENDPFASEPLAIGPRGKDVNEWQKKSLPKTWSFLKGTF